MHTPSLPDPATDDFAAFFQQEQQKDLLRLLTCGSVDDGKSTLIGRLLYDANGVFDDQLAAVKRDTAKYGTTGEEIDFALLVDGLSAEREQGITIDVAYRYFATPKRKFIIADTPGHEQYTRNMATGASTADLAIILIDARKGVLNQTRRHAFIATLMGIRRLVIAVNKMDLVHYDPQVFEAICRDCRDVAARLPGADLHFIPLSALKGENVVTRSENMPWFQGAPLLAHLETVHIDTDRNLVDLRFPVQHVLRPHQDFRGYSGSLVSGRLRLNDLVTVLPSGKQSRIKSLFVGDQARAEVYAPQAVTAVLTDELDVSRGDMFIHPNNAPTLTNRLEAMVVWLSEQPAQLHHNYLLKHCTTQTTAQMQTWRYRVNVNDLHREPIDALTLNDIARVQLDVARPLAVDPYSKNRSTGAFILVDRLTNATLAAGLVLDRQPADDALNRRRDALDAGSHVRPQISRVTPAQRVAQWQQQPFTLWFTGLPSAGKTTLAYALEAALFARGHLVCVLDGENLRLGLSRDLGFSPEDRFEHQRRTAAVAKLLNEAGFIVLVAVLAPMAADREQVKRLIGEDQMLQVYCQAPLEVCEARDTSGLYAKARRGELQRVTGIDAPFEPPTQADFVLDTAHQSPEDAVEQLLAGLAQRQWLRPL